MSQQELLKRVLQALEDLGIDYILLQVEDLWKRLKDEAEVL